MGSVLTIWLNEYGYDKQWIGLYSLLSIPFCFKIFWTPFVDNIFFSRKWTLASALVMMSASIYTMGVITPATSPYLLSASILTLALFTGCLYIAGIAYEIESLEESEYGKGSAWVVSGYRIGLLLSGSGILFLSDIASWSMAFKSVAGLLILIATLIILQKDPRKPQEGTLKKKGFWNDTIIAPCQSFLKNSSWTSVIMILLLFKIGDHLSKSMTGPFLLSLGFNKTDLAGAYKAWGMAATISGAFIAGLFLRRDNPYYLMGIFGILHSISLACFAVLAIVGKSFPGLYISVALENLSGGMAMTAFMAMLWKVCDRQYAQVQYTLLWSLFAFKSDLFAMCGGFLATLCTWDIFFWICSGISISAAIISLTISGKGIILNEFLNNRKATPN